MKAVTKQLVLRAREAYQEAAKAVDAAVVAIDEDRRYGDQSDADYMAVILLRDVRSKMVDSDNSMKMYAAAKHAGYVEK